ncbi:hypothetical protein DMB65_07950 [Flavobacterium cheongpyeongense]|uniref:Uncharacterized protein n=1 Tax=Flavobacterium cheongpyeongense TaxID=2212651 RepID=A0A2V4BQK8_9FLAO|nr:hypothetical protein [Flavobacterium cheongpyeongense]PXY41326.1 hypothetical protein DMB65_07950 [Flavobacterium cheongpyeongense]
MKKIRLYKKIEPVGGNFEQYLRYAILPLLVASYIFYPILYFLGTEAALFYNIILAFTAAYFYKGLRKFSSFLCINSSDQKIRSLISFVVILIILLITNYGFYLLVLYQKNNEFSSINFYSWLVILFGIPLMYYSFKLAQYHYVKKQQDQAFVSIELVISYDLDLFLAIDTIHFVNTVNRKSSDIKITNNIRSYSQKEFMAMKTKSRYYYINKEGFRETVQIPFNANMFLLSWFSYVENKYYCIEIPFPFKKFIEEQEKCSIDKFKVFTGSETKPLYLHLYLNGGFKFFYKDVILIDCPENKEQQISEEHKKMKFG